MKLIIPEQVCDSHIHIGYFPQLKITFTLNDLISLMDKYTIASALIFPSFFDVDKQMDNILNVVQRRKSQLGTHDRKKIYALLRSTPQTYTSNAFLKRLETLLESRQVVGMKINSSVERHRITDGLYRNCLETLNRYGAILLLHCGRWVEMSGWQYGVKTAKKYPKIKVILAHMGGTHPDLSFPAIEDAKNIPNIYFDTSQTRQTVVIKKGIETLGASRILFASDMPWGDYVQNLVGITQLDLDEETLNKILKNNFNKLIKGE